MRQKVSEYIAAFLVDHGIKDVFEVVGGGAMHLNDAFGHNDNLHVTYCHHEQACSIAAECYFRVNNRVAAVCVTSGPGAINALNGVTGAYMDSIPMLVFSGQTKTTLTVKKSGLDLRTLGNQEFEITSAIGKMCKYSEMVMDARKIRYCLEKALATAVEGRPGPCWLDVPLDIQGTFVETDELVGYIPTETMSNTGEVRRQVKDIAERIQKAQRPVIYAGNGIRIAQADDLLLELAQRLQTPVVTCWDSIDLMETDSVYYVGRGGIMGDRAGNFAVQNSDMLLCIGTRLNIYQVGYNAATWAREAYVVDVDVDPLELIKPTIRVDLPVCSDAYDFIEVMLQETKGKEFAHDEWIHAGSKWKEKYPVVLPGHFSDESPVNVYAFIDVLSRRLPEKAVTVVANGSASVVGSAAYYIRKGQRFLMNCGLSSMGYGLPASIGACIANHGRQTICIEGDGSIMMNLQELQTLSTNELPVKLFVINNDGYQQIRITQKNLFDGAYVGIGPDSNDLGFPDFQKLSDAFGISYYRIDNSLSMADVIDQVLQEETCCLCEVFVTKEQVFEPKSATKRLPDGRLVSPPLEDLAPFLSRDELRENMFIDLMEE